MVYIGDSISLLSLSLDAYDYLQRGSFSNATIIKRSEKDNEEASNESFNERRKNVLISKEMALNCLSIFITKETSCKSATLLKKERFIQRL